MESNWSNKVIESSPYCIAQVRIIVDEKNEPVDYLYLNCNEAYVKTKGKKKEEIIGKNALTFNEGKTKFGFDWVQFLGNVALYRDFDETVQLINDKKQYIRVFAYKIAPLEVAFNYLDITHEMERVQLHEQLFDISPAPMLVLSKEGIILKANLEWSKFLDYSPASLKGKSIFDFIHEEDHRKTMDCLDTLNSEEGTCSLVNRYRHNDGSYKEISWRARRTRGYILGAGIDITELNKREHDFRRQVELNTLLLKNSLTGMFTTMMDIPFDCNNISYNDETIDFYMKKARIVQVNDAFTHQYKLPKEKILGRNLYDIFSSDIHQGRSYFKEIHQKGTSGVEAKMALRDGSHTWVYSEITLLKDSKGRVVGHLGFQIDINDRKKNELALIQREEQFRLLSEYASDIIWVYNLTTRSFQYVSPAVLRILGWSPDEILEGDYTLTLCPEEISRVKRTVIAWALEFRKKQVINKNWSIQIRHQSRTKKIIWSESTINFRMNIRDEIEVIGISRDISEKKIEEENLLYNSYHDQLTKVYNRRYFKEKMAEFIANRCFPLSIIICDVNGLKLTNDVFGHTVGDAILFESASLLQSHAREGDIVARYGGDEFVMVLPKTSLDVAKEILDQMKAESEKIYVQKTALSISFGCAEQKDETFSSDEVYAKAEHLLYRAKLVESSMYKQSVITLLITSLFSKNKEIERHSERVAVLCQSIAQQLKLDQHDTDELYIAGRLHDIGKIGLDEHLLVPNSQLNNEQILQKQRHCELGYHILNSVQNFGKIADWILSHHEQPDGGGYPRKLKGRQIPLQSHIIHAASSYDNYIAQYSNPTSQDVDRVLRIMSASIDTGYDQRAVAALTQLPYDVLTGK